jgi:hypothetical protein
MKNGTTINESARLEYDEEDRKGRSDPLPESFGESSQETRFDLSLGSREIV